MALQQAIAEHKWDALITGIRRDEDPTRAKERYFSPRNAQSEWDYKDQPPEFWGQFATANGKGEHVRVQPLLDWREVDIWRYIQREEYPHSENVFRARGKTFSLVRLQSDYKTGFKQRQHDRRDYRRAGRNAHHGARAGRAQDHHERNAMQKLRAKGFL